MNLINDINNNISHIVRFLVNLSINKKDDIVPLFNFYDSENLEIYTLNNDYILYLNKESCKNFEIKDLTSFQNKEIVYLIYTTEGCYVGHTGDFHDRMYCHIKDTSNTERLLYESIRNNKKCYVSILHMFDCDDSGKIGREVEKSYTKELISCKNNQSLTPYVFNSVI